MRIQRRLETLSSSYSHMLAEVGRTSEASVLKSLKTGQTLELENLRSLVSSLEERIKAHQQYQVVNQQWLCPQSMEPINEWTSITETMHTRRSVSELDFGCRSKFCQHTGQCISFRWLEEGAEPPAPEASLPHHHPRLQFLRRSKFQGEAPPHNTGNLGMPTTMDNSPGMPPLPPTANQYSARRRMGV
ncbi:hypothetical protein OROMI_005093 [Orobanche minor]